MLNKELFLLTPTNNVGKLTINITWSATTLLGALKVHVYKNDALVKTIGYPYGGGANQSTTLIDVKSGDELGLKLEKLKITSEHIDGLITTGTQAYIVDRPDCSISLNVYAVA